MPDVVEQILSWPLDEAVNDSYDHFIYNTANVETVIYTKGSDLITGVDPTPNGGQWSIASTGYITTTKYLEVNFTAKTGATDKWLEITDIEFDAANFFTGIFLVKNFFLAYSFNSNFTDSVIVYDFPEGDISTASTGSPASFSYTFPIPIILEAGEDIYFRFYPYNGDPAFSTFVLMRSTFLINGIVRPTPTVSSFSTFKFQKNCLNSNNLIWT